ncbi:hypothetical protein EV182_004291, partial [Spiromyces aspiralis]
PSASPLSSMLYFDGESKPIALQGGTAPPVGDDRIALDQRLVHARSEAYVG